MGIWKVTKVIIEYYFNPLTDVGMTGFEPAAPSSRTKCATGLRYIPNLIF